MTPLNSNRTPRNTEKKVPVVVEPADESESESEEEKLTTMAEVVTEANRFKSSVEFQTRLSLETEKIVPEIKETEINPNSLAGISETSN